MSFFQNTCKPEGIGGKIMVNMMNAGHSSMAEWGFTHIEIRNDYRCLDIGCGGGANVKKLLVKTPYGKVIGIDYSEVSVIKSSKINKAEIENKHCEILQNQQFVRRLSAVLLRTDWTVCRKCDIIELVKTNLERSIVHVFFSKYL